GPDELLRAETLDPRRAFVGPRSEIDADLPYRALDRDKHVLPGGISGDVVDLEPQRRAATVADAVAVAVAPPRFLEQPGRTRPIEGYCGDVVAMLPDARRDGREGRLRAPPEESRCKSFAVDRHQNRAADPHIVGRSPL